MNQSNYLVIFDFSLSVDGGGIKWSISELECCECDDNPPTEWPPIEYCEDIRVGLTPYCTGGLDSKLLPAALGVLFCCLRKCTLLPSGFSEIVAAWSPWKLDTYWLIWKKKIISCLSIYGNCCFIKFIY